MSGGVPVLRNGPRELLERLVRRLPSQRLPRAVVHQVGNGVKRILIMNAQVCALGHKGGGKPPLVFW